MNVSVEKAGTCRKTITVELPVETVNAEYNEMLQTFSKMAAIPGFRKGRAPIALVENHYKRRITEETQDRLIARSYHQALDEAKVDPVLLLDVQAELKKDQPLTYRLTAEVAPEFKLPRYKGITVKPGNIEVTDDMIEKSLQEFLEQNSTYTEVTDQSIAEGDFATVDYDGKMDDSLQHQLGKENKLFLSGRNQVILIIENSTFLPGLDKELVGLKPGEEKQFDAVFPDNFKVKALVGKTIPYHFQIKSVHTHQKAELDEKLFKQLKVADEQELRDQLRENLVKQTQENELNRVKNEIRTQLLAKTEMDVPESLARDQTMRVISSMTRQMVMNGATREDIAAHRAELIKQAEETAAQRIKLSYILHRISREENIEVSDEELNARINLLAQQYKTTPEQLTKQLREENELNSLRNDILMDKTMDFLVAGIKIGEEGFLSRLMGGGKRPAGETAAGKSIDSNSNTGVK